MIGCECLVVLFWMIGIEISVIYILHDNSMIHALHFPGNRDFFCADYPAMVTVKPPFYAKACKKITKTEPLFGLFLNYINLGLKKQVDILTKEQIIPLDRGHFQQ